MTRRDTVVCPLCDCPFDRYRRDCRRPTDCVRAHIGHAHRERLADAARLAEAAVGAEAYPLFDALAGPAFDVVHADYAALFDPAERAELAAFDARVDGRGRGAA